MKVYVLKVDPNDYDSFPYVYGVYGTKEKAESAVKIAAIENNEPALILTKDYDTWECADCWHYPEYEQSRYYIAEYELE